MCRAHHWAFDAGLFSLTGNYEVLVSPLVEHAESKKFEMASLAGKVISPPRREDIKPHLQAIEWHRDNVFRG